MAKNIKQVYDANPSTTLSNNDLLYTGKSPYGGTNDSAIKQSDYFTQLAGSFVQTTGSVTSGHLAVYGASGQIIKDCGISVDTSHNIYPNNAASAYTTTVTSGGTKTLTVADTYNQFFTGTSTHTVVLPVTSTLTTGFPFYFVNTSTGNLTVQSSGGNTVQVMAPNSAAYITCILTSGTTAASWYADATGVGTDLFPNGTVLVTNSTQTMVNGTFYTADAAGIVTFTLPGVSVGSYFGIAGINGWTFNVPGGITATIGNVTLVGGASAFWSSTGGSETVIFQWIGGNILQAVSWTGLPVTSPGGSTPLPIIAGSNISITRSGANMSIGLNATYSTNQLIYASGSTTLAGLATANSGVVVTSTSGVPSVLASPSDTRSHVLFGRAAGGMNFSTAYYPNTGTLTGQMIGFDGTGYGNTTSTYADTYTINNLLFASGTNAVTGLATANSSVLVTSSGGVPSIAQTLPSAVQTNITALGTQSQALNMNSHLINNVTDPASAQDAATKNYVDARGLGFIWNINVTTNQTIAGSNGYQANNSGATVVLSLPVVSVVGAVYQVCGGGSATTVAWKIAQSLSGQAIQLGTQTTTAGTSGFLQATAATDWVELVCVSGGGVYLATVKSGNITVN